MPKFLPIELSSTSFGHTVLPASMEVLFWVRLIYGYGLYMEVYSNFYLLKAVVRCASHRFTIAIKSGSYCLYYDDMCTAVQQRHFKMFWMLMPMDSILLAVYESSLMPSVDDNLHKGNDSCTLMLEHSFFKIRE